jgi:transposase
MMCAGGADDDELPLVIRQEFRKLRFQMIDDKLGRRRCSTLQVVCMDMWAAYVNLVREHAPQAQILFDRFHMINICRRQSMRYGGAKCGA